MIINHQSFPIPDSDAIPQTTRRVVSTLSLATIADTNHFAIGFITYWIMLSNDFMQKKIITNFAVQMI